MSKATIQGLVTGINGAQDGSVFFVKIAEPGHGNGYLVAGTQEERAHEVLVRPDLISKVQVGSQIALDCDVQSYSGRGKDGQMSRFTNLRLHAKKVAGK